MFADIAYAMGQAPAGQPPQGGGLMGLMPLVLIFIIFYFLLIRPQQKKTKAHQDMVNALKSGDKVITNGGMYGKITKVDGDMVTVEVADKVRIKFSRQAISGLQSTGQEQQNATNK